MVAALSSNNVSAAQVVADFKKTIEDRHWSPQDLGTGLWNFHRFLESQGIDPSDPQALAKNPRALDELKALIAKDGDPALKAVLAGYERSLGPEPSKDYWETAFRVYEGYKAAGGPVLLYRPEEELKETLPIASLHDFSRYLTDKAQRAANRNGVIDLSKLGDLDAQAIKALTKGSVTMAELKRGIDASIHVLSKLDGHVGKLEPERRGAILARLQDPDLWDGKISLKELGSFDPKDPRLNGRDARTFYEIGSRWQNARDNETKWDGTRDTFLGLSGNVGFIDAKVEQRQLNQLIDQMREIRDGFDSGKYNNKNLQRALDQIRGAPNEAVAYAWTNAGASWRQELRSVLQHLAMQAPNFKLGSYPLAELDQQSSMFEAIHTGNRAEAQRIGEWLSKRFPDSAMAQYYAAVGRGDF